MFVSNLDIDGACYYAVWWDEIPSSGAGETKGAHGHPTTSPHAAGMWYQSYLLGI